MDYEGYPALNCSVAGTLEIVGE
ncbi:MAG: hypothetical protein QOC59_806, partial [Microbacteriaceae bacterium]|nr:hypothetical protein [Microbacteriaceae bacterium]